MRLKKLKGVLVAAVAIGVLPGIGFADAFLSGAGGVFKPWRGDVGYEARAQCLGSVTDHFLGGAELEYRDYKTSMFGAEDVPFNTVSLRAILTYAFSPKGVVNPYVGAGMGVNFNYFGVDKVKQGHPELANVPGFSTGFEILGLVGVAFPLGERIALFVEGRAGLAYQLTAISLDASNAAGISGLGGIQYRF